MKRLSKILLAAAVVLVMTMGLSAKADAAEWSGLAVGDDGQWHYYTDGSVDWGYTGMAWNEYGWWYVTNGSIDFSYTGMASNENGWFYFSNGARFPLNTASPPVLLYGLSNGLMTSGFKFTAFLIFSPTVFPVTVMQSVFRSPASASSFITAYTPPASFKSSI